LDIGDGGEMAGDCEGVSLQVADNGKFEEYIVTV
jgi:hypothetical protein